MSPFGRRNSQASHMPTGQANGWPRRGRICRSGTSRTLLEVSLVRPPDWNGDSVSPVCRAACGGRAQAQVCVAGFAPSAKSAAAVCRRFQRRKPPTRPSPSQRVARLWPASGTGCHQDPCSVNARASAMFLRSDAGGGDGRRSASTRVRGDGVAGDQSGMAQICAGKGRPRARTSTCSPRRRK